MKLPAYLVSALMLTCILSAEVSLPSLFTDHMVLQRNQENRIWGKADPGEAITVTIDGQTHATKSDSDGQWQVNLDAMPAGGPHELVIEGNNTVTINDVLLGEVWLCSGQSNMEWPLSRSNDGPLEIKSANYPQIRLLSVPNYGTQEPQHDFAGAWQVCSPQTVGDFSAIGYYFAWRLQQVLGVPIGVIDNAWGGSRVETWIPREAFMDDPELIGLLAGWDKRMENYTDATYEQSLLDYEEKLAAFIAGGKQGNWPHRPSNIAKGQIRPANAYNGSMLPLLGFGIKGAIWYQGESNGGLIYHKLFPLFITTLREKWGLGDFPFYWVQLVDYQAETDDPNAKSGWSILREAQTMTMDYIENGGQAVAIDVGEGRDIHPRNKRVPADRLARWALANQYDIDLVYRSPQYESMEIEGNKALLTFGHVNSLYTFDVKEPVGFAIAGEDSHFVWAEAKLVGQNQIEVWSDEVPNPVAVRYGWAQNPKVNVYSREGLPLTPFRTDVPDEVLQLLSK